MSPSSVSCSIDLHAPGKRIGHLRIHKITNTAGWASTFIHIGCVVNGDGPTVLVLGGNHGDEYEGQVAGMRLLCLVHHHVSSDWYPRVVTRDTGGLMDPARGVEALADVCKLTDPDAIILHGHLHVVMPLGYTWRGLRIGNPGGFAEARRLNLLDVDGHGEIVMSQVELR